MVAPDLGRLVSEGRNPNTADIDQLPTLDVLRRINDEDKLVAAAVEKELPRIAEAVDRIVAAFQAGGRLIYVGAGTSGRLGVLDASECPPTFGVPEDMVVGLIAGGEHALRHAAEGAEDDAGQGAADIAALDLGPNDIIVGIAASGRTPYVIGALERAKSAGAATVALSCNEGSPIAAIADIAISPIVGPEAITGSTRMKSGTAQKMVLNMLTTAAMIRTGKVYGNLMVDLHPNNEKLRERAVGMVMQVAGCHAGQAAIALEKSGHDVKLAILMTVSGLDAPKARARLEAAGGILREAIDPRG